jgi:hypothetical protein
MAASAGLRGKSKRNAEVPPEPNEDSLEKMMRVMKEQIVVAANLVNRPVQPPPPPPKARNPVLDFLKCDPPPFTGGDDPLEAQSWLNILNNIFECLHCRDEQKVNFAAYMLKGNADNWWNFTCKLSTGKPTDWEHFQKVFLDRYFPKFIRKQKELEFMHLQQGDMSVAEYVAKFEELARFSSHFRFSLDEEFKIDHFEWGLRPDIQSFIAEESLRKCRLEFTSYDTLVHESYAAEESLKNFQEECDLKRQQTKDPSKYSQHLKVRVPQNKGKQVQTSISPRTGMCSECGKNHRGECLAGKNVCYWCKQPGHVIQNCLTLKQEEVTNSSNSST